MVFQLQQPNMSTASVFYESDTNSDERYGSFHIYLHNYLNLNKQPQLIRI